MTQEQEIRLQESLDNWRRIEKEVKLSQNNVLGISPIWYVLVFVLLFGFTLYVQFGNHRPQYSASVDNSTTNNINLGSRPLLGQYQCIATRAYFHKNAGYGKQKKVFIISGDFVQITNISQDNSFGYAVYISVSGKQTEGWLKLSDLSRAE